MIQLDILCIGSLERDNDGKILEAHSTSTLIRVECKRNIVVDTSTEYMWPAVKTSFRQIGIFPEDVDTVILTHAHSDHIENLKRYRNAKVYVHAGGPEIPGAIIVQEDEFQVCPGIKMVHTPGHSDDSVSVFVEGDDRKYVVAGDAVPMADNLREDKVPAVNTDPEKAKDSLKRIRGYADVVVPGHGAPFIVR